MATTVHCPHCGRVVPRQPGPDARCPACHEPIAGSQVEAARSSAAAGPSGPARWTQSEISASEFPVPAGGYEDLQLDPEPDSASSSRPLSQPGRSATKPPPVLRHHSESSLAAARMANVPTFKAANPRSGFPILPIGVGVVLVIAITAFALTRAKPASPPLAQASAGGPLATTIGRPPAPLTPPAAEPEPPRPAVALEAPAEPAPPPRERRKTAEREAPVRPAQPREVARNEKAAANRPAAANPAPTPTPAPAPKAVAEPPPPPQFVAAPAQAPPAASAPLAIGPAYAREGYQKARQASPGCVVNSLQRTRDLGEVAGESATVKFAVDETGKVSQFSYLAGPTDERVANAIWAAVQRCEWVPGATAQGRPITLWVTMPVKFGK